MMAAKAAKPSAAPMPASVPSALMAPSVPLGTLLRVVTRYVVWPYACAVWFLTNVAARQQRHRKSKGQHWNRAHVRTRM